MMGIGGNGPAVFGGSSFTPTTWNNGDISGGSLSGGNLIFTFAGGGSDGGVRSVAGQSTGKYFFEIAANTTGSDAGVGISVAGAVFTALGNDATGGAVLYISGNAWINGSLALTAATGVWSGSLTTVGIAMDTVNKLIWWEIANNTWSNGGDPAGGTGGLSYSALTGPFYALSVGSAGNPGTYTANFGATAFTFSVPGGFTPGLG